MINNIAGIINSGYYAKIAERDNKVTTSEQGFKRIYTDKINAVANVTPATSSRNDRTKEAQQFYTTKVEENKEGEKSLVMLAGYQIYRQINLNGTTVKKDPSLVNPVKIKNAYFLDED